jgi:hypothetical protein
MHDGLLAADPPVATTPVATTKRRLAARMSFE